MLIFKRAETPKELEEMYRITEEVYWNKHGYRIKKDKYDDYSIHFIALDAVGIVGCGRLIRYSPIGFPIEKEYYELPPLDLDRERMVEVSRLVVTKPRLGYKIIAGLSTAFYRYNKEHGITHCFAILQPALVRVLKRLGFPFSPIRGARLKWAPQGVKYFALAVPSILVMEEVELKL